MEDGIGAINASADTARRIAYAIGELNRGCGVRSKTFLTLKGICLRGVQLKYIETIQQAY